MSEEEALIQAVEANLNDDTPRGVYADWLDENGQRDKADFLRHEVEVNRRFPRGFSTEFTEVESNRTKLFDLIDETDRTWLLRVNRWLVKPDGLCPTGETAYHIVRNRIIAENINEWETYTRFRSPKECEADGDDTGHDAVLVVNFAGSEGEDDSIGILFDPVMDDGPYERLQSALKESGLRSERLDDITAGIYRDGTGPKLNPNRREEDDDDEPFDPYYD